MVNPLTQPQQYANIYLTLNTKGAQHLEKENVMNSDGNGSLKTLSAVIVMLMMILASSLCLSIANRLKINHQQRQIDQLCVATTLLVLNNSTQACAFTNLQQGQYTVCLANYSDNSAVCLYDDGATNYYIHVHDIPGNYLRRWKQGVNRLFLRFPNKPNN